MSSHSFYLRSGRYISIPRAAMDGVYLNYIPTFNAFVPVTDDINDEVNIIFSGDEPLTKDEKKEIAQSVSDAWMKWADEPVSAPKYNDDSLK